MAHSSIFRSIFPKAQLGLFRPSHFRLWEVLQTPPYKCQCPQMFLMGSLQKLKAHKLPYVQFSCLVVEQHIWFPKKAPLNLTAKHLVKRGVWFEPKTKNHLGSSKSEILSPFITCTLTRKPTLIGQQGQERFALGFLAEQVFSDKASGQKRNHHAAAKLGVLQPSLMPMNSNRHCVKHRVVILSFWQVLCRTELLAAEDKIQEHTSLAEI